MKKLFYSAYALLCYSIFLVVLLYLIGFVADMFVPKTINQGGFGVSLLGAISINLFLLSLFGIQHSVMARQQFKEKWTKVVPKPIERSTYVLFSSLVLINLMYFWNPIQTKLWDFTNGSFANIMTALSFVGWGIVLISTFLINHFDLFGLRQVYCYTVGKPVQKLKFRTPLFYKIIRHPIYFGFLIAFWSAPTMTAGHLLFCLGMTVYIFIGISHEEKDLVRAFGPLYEKYKQKTFRIIPFFS